MPQDAADRIVEVCRTVELDVAALGRDAAAGNPVVPLVKALEAAVGAAAGPYLHRGATSQDVLHTAMVLVARRALDLIVADLVRCADTAPGPSRTTSGPAA